jgi:hypothetical protein
MAAVSFPKLLMALISSNFKTFIDSPFSIRAQSVPTYREELRRKKPQRKRTKPIPAK